jgi:uncharacterized membrane protein
MHIVALAWMFVVVLMVAAEASSSQGTLLGAFITLLLYGVLPLSIVLYVMGTPGRRRARRLQEAAAAAAAVTTQHDDSPAQGDGSRHAAGPPVAAERKEP